MKGISLEVLAAAALFALAATAAAQPLPFARSVAVSPPDCVGPANIIGQESAAPVPRPEDYVIVSFGILGEVFPGTGDADNVSFAASVKGLTLRGMALPRPAERASRFP